MRWAQMDRYGRAPQLIEFDSPVRDSLWTCVRAENSRTTDLKCTARVSMSLHLLGQGWPSLEHVRRTAMRVLVRAAVGEVVI